MLNMMQNTIDTLKVAVETLQEKIDGFIKSEKMLKEDLNNKHMQVLKLEIENKILKHKIKEIITSLDDNRAGLLYNQQALDIIYETLQNFNV